MDIHSLRERQFGPGGWAVLVADLDGTIFHGTSTLVHIGKTLGITDRIAELIGAYEAGSMSNATVSSRAASALRGYTQECLVGAMAGIPTLNNIRENVAYLNQLGVRTAVATLSFDFAAGWAKKEFLFSESLSVQLEYDENHVATGRLVDSIEAQDKMAFLLELCSKAGASPSNSVYVGDSRSDFDAFRAAGYSIAVNASETARTLTDAALTTTSFDSILAAIPAFNTQYST